MVEYLMAALELDIWLPWEKANGGGDIMVSYGSYLSVSLIITTAMYSMKHAKIFIRVALIVVLLIGLFLLQFQYHFYIVCIFSWCLSWVELFKIQRREHQSHMEQLIGSGCLGDPSAR